MDSTFKSRKDQIRHVAQELFRSRGYTATSMRDLASAVGIEAASLYSHVRSKEELLRDICFEMAEAFFQAIAFLEKSAESPEIKLRQAIRAHIGVIAAHLDEAAVFFHDWRHLSEPSLSEFKALRDQYEEIWRSLLREGMAAGIFREGDARFMTRTLFSALNWTYEWYKPEGKMTPEELGDQLAEVLLKGVVKGS